MSQMERQVQNQRPELLAAKWLSRDRVYKIHLTVQEYVEEYTEPTRGVILLKFRERFLFNEV